MPWSEGGGGYLALGEDVFLKRLEIPCAYNARTDDLYELSEDALEFLRRCDGSRTAAELAPGPAAEGSGNPEEEEFVASCLEEGVLERLEKPARRDVRVGVNSTPSLRYLAVEVTGRCNLRCRHCYQGGQGGQDAGLDLGLAVLGAALEEFAEMGGLRLMITGGEPLLHPLFPEIGRLLDGRPYRRVLITNGTVTPPGGYTSLGSLGFDEVQFSLDGLEAGHDFLRGPGNFARSLRSLEEALGAGVDVSVATVLHARNLDEVEGLGRLLEEKGVSSWTLEFPVPEGSMRDAPGLMPDPAAAVPLMDLEWGSGVHEGAAGYACGAHLASVLPSGSLVKCDYYADVTGGGVGGGLRRAWEALPREAIAGVCAGCELLEECGGGCRYRALILEGEGGPDPVMCARHGRPA